MLTLPDGTDSWYTTQELCSVLHCHKSTLAKWKREGVAPDSFLLGRDRLWPMSAVNEWMQAQQARAQVISE